MFSPAPWRSLSTDAAVPRTELSRSDRDWTDQLCRTWIYKVKVLAGNEDMGDRDLTVRKLALTQT